MKSHFAPLDLENKKQSEPKKVWDYYGLSSEAWTNLTTHEREVHYNRVRACDHVYEYSGVEGNNADERLRWQDSHDPYFATPHMMACTHELKCPCQMCVGQIGIARGTAEEMVL